MSSAVCRRTSNDSSAFVFQASKEVTLSRVCCIMSSNPSNRLESSSMDDDIWVSNLVGFRGARARAKLDLSGAKTRGGRRRRSG